MEYKIEKLDNKGRGICFVDGKITFVENALIDEFVKIDIKKSKKKFNEASVSKYIKTSVKRVEPICKLYNQCGGCNLMHLNYEEQLEFKKNRVKDILEKFAGIKIDNININKTSKLNYRNKVTLKVKEKMGYYKKENYDIVPVCKCFIADDKINEIIENLKNMNLKNVYEIVIRASKNTSDTMVIFKTNGELLLNYNDLNVNSIVLFNNNKYKTLKGLDYIIEKLNDISFIVSPDSFFQVNTIGAEKLYNKILDFSNLKGNENILDLYCGTGTIGIFLSNYVSSVIGVEINKYAVEDAIKNKKLNKIENIDFICDDAENIDFKNIDLVVIDPPRSGLSQKMINYLMNLNVPRIIYVSCDSVTLARDLKMLKEKYELKHIELIDMFPQTYHVECVCVLKLK